MKDLIANIKILRAKKMPLVWMKFYWHITSYNV